MPENLKDDDEAVLEFLLDTVQDPESLEKLLALEGGAELLERFGGTLEGAEDRLQYVLTTLSENYFNT
jgi:hypothetical protein